MGFNMCSQVLWDTWEYIPKGIIFKVRNNEDSLHPMELRHLDRKYLSSGVRPGPSDYSETISESHVNVYTTHRLPTPHWP